MKLRSLRCAFVAVAAVLMSQFAVQTPAANASGYCGNGTTFVGSTTGYLDYYEQDWYETVAPGNIQLSASDYYAYIEVWDATCQTRLCSAGYYYYLTCSLSATERGPVNIAVWNAYGNPMSYTVTAADTPDAPDVPTECSDGIDNDLNGSTDYPNDPGCYSYNDNNEAGAPSQCSIVGGFPVCVAIRAGDVVTSQTVYSLQTYTTATHRVAGAIDIYRFPLPTGGAITAPCITLGVNSSSSNACTQAGGTFVSRLASLVDQNVNQPGVRQGAAIATVRVCEATLTATVAGIGVEDFPVLSTC